MFEFLRAVQLNAMMVFSGICGTMAFLVLLTESLSRRRRLILMSLELSATLLLIFDRYSYVFRGDVSNLGYHMVRISNFLVFFFTLVVAYSFNHYVRDLCANELGLKKTPLRITVSDSLLILGLILLIASRFFNFYYAFDKTNHYYRTEGFYICYGIPLIALFLNMSVVLSYYKKLRRAIRIPLILFSVVPIIAAIIQIYAYGLSLTNIAIVGMAVTLYIFALRDMNKVIDRARNFEIEMLKEEQRNSQLIFEQTAQALSFAIDAKDKYTHGHSLRVAEYSRKIARATGVPEKECDKIYYTGLLHDVGKIGVQDTIINKDGKLTEEEFAQIKSHPVIGRNILSSINKLPYLSIGANFHHERYDGKGYPAGLKGEDIPYIARIIAVADAYDAMTSKRSYRDPLPQQKVREELVKGIGTQFDPVYAKEMVHMIDLDSEYTMKEREESKALEGRNIIFCDEYRSDISEGIVVTRCTSDIRIRCRAEDDASYSAAPVVPTIILFDSLDARVHDKGNNIAKEMVYYEYGEIRLDGETVCHGARKLESRTLSPDPVRILSDKVGNYLTETIYDINAVKFDDHVRIRVYSADKAFEITVALPDSARYAYIAFSGEHCTINIESINRSETPVEEHEIRRIAEKVSYIDSPAGDIPNLQVNGWCAESSPGIKITDGLQIKMHAMSLPTARLVWHCPYLSVFTSDDGIVKGKNYREFCLMRLDGESWETDDYVTTSPLVSKLDGFEDWDIWKAKNREGFDCTINVHRQGNLITVYTVDNFVELKNTINITDENVHDLYLALTGDQVALTNIRITPCN